MMRRSGAINHFKGADMQMTQDTVTKQARGVAAALILLGILGRLVPHPWNVTPITAMALFAGAYLPRRWGLLIPLAAVAISDLFLGWHATIPFTWGAFALIGALGWWVRRSPSVGRIAAGTLTGSFLFFVITNKAW